MHGCVKADPDALKGPTIFTEDKDLFLTRAFVNASENAVDGANQKGNSFWKEVHEKMCQLYDAEADVAVQKKWPWTIPFKPWI